MVAAPKKRRQFRPSSRHAAYQYLALQYVMYAKTFGDLPKLDGQIKCEDCDSPATAYEHRDYTMPIDVVPVCRSCNGRRGPAIGPVKRSWMPTRLTPYACLLEGVVEILALPDGKNDEAKQIASRVLSMAKTGTRPKPPRVSEDDEPTTNPEGI